MLAVVLVILAVAGAWVLGAVALAFLAGGVIRNREQRDARAGGTTAGGRIRLAR